MVMYGGGYTPAHMPAAPLAGGYGNTGPMTGPVGTGVPGGPPLPGAASPGMSPLAGAGLLAMLGGGILDYMGQRRGAQSMQDEAERQAAEQEALSIQRHGMLTKELGRFDPQSQQAFTTGALLRSQAATRPALSAGGKALGLSGSSVASAGRSLLPMQRLQATQQGGRDVDRQMAERMRTLGIDMSGIDDEQQMLAALYPMRNQIAGQAGAGYRLAGGMLSGVGAPAVNLAMARAA
jgi:hypothetical protein